MRSGTDSGPVKLTWNKRNQEEVRMAEKSFNEYIRSSWMAYCVNVDQRKIQIFTFNPDLEEIFLIPLEEGG